MPEKESAKARTPRPARVQTDTASGTFTDEERAAMKERAREQKAAARRGSRSSKADGERDVLAKIAEMPEQDRVMAERLHALITSTAPDLSPRTWYGMPAYAKGGDVVCSSRVQPSSSRDTRRSASATRRISTRAPCGRPPSR